MTQSLAQGQHCHNAKARDGTCIGYTLYPGHGSGRVALVHSLAMDRTFWERVVATLTSDAALLVFDCRGHGASGKPDMPYTVDLFADDLADLMDHVGWKSAVIAGASMGGCVSLAFAGAYPDRTDGLGLIDTTASYGDTAIHDWAVRARRALDGGMEALVEFQKTRWFGDEFRARNPEILQRALDVFVANDVNAYAQTCRMLGACDKRAVLPELTCPVRIVVGEEDYATPVAMAQAMVAAVPHSSMHIIAGARHFTPLEVPDVIADHLGQLLQEAAQK